MQSPPHTSLPSDQSLIQNKRLRYFLDAFSGTLQFHCLQTLVYFVFQGVEFLYLVLLEVENSFYLKV